MQARPDHAAQDDQLDAIAIEQDVGDVEAVGDDREVGPVDQLVHELDRRGAAGHDDRLPIPDQTRSRRRHALLLTQGSSLPA